MAMKRTALALLGLTPFLLAPLSLGEGAPPAAATEDAYRQAHAHLAAHRYAEAAAGFEIATATTNAAAAASAWLGRGEALYQLKQWDASIAAYDALLKAYPDSPLAANALYARGYAEHQAGRLQQALATFTAFEAKYPAHAFASACATSAERISRTLEAHARQQAAAALTCDLAAINLFLREEKFAEASVAAELFLKEHPDTPQATELRYLTADCAYRATNYVRAVEAYRLFTDRHPQDARVPAARARLADSLFQTARYDEARTLYEALAKAATDPQEKARMTLALGDSLAALKKWDEAERLYRDIEVLQDCDALRPAALGRLAELYDKSGQPEKARSTREDLRRRYTK